MIVSDKVLSTLSTDLIMKSSYAKTSDSILKNKENIKMIKETKSNAQNKQSMPLEIN